MKFNMRVMLEILSGAGDGHMVLYFALVFLPV
jgi:hypothetical protein